MRNIIPLSRQSILGREQDYVLQALAQENWGGGGMFCRQAEEFIESQFGTKRVILTSSCTTALNICGLLSGVRAGDEVIMPSFTFPSTANAFLLRGAKPVFLDIRPDTQNIDETLIEDAITDRTRAICIVHYAGVACEMDAIMEIAARHGLLVVEDAAQGIFAKYKNRWLGTIGDLGCYSFHATKNISCGEGGALLVNNSEFIERVEILCEKGTNRAEFSRGDAKKYQWCDLGTSVSPSEAASAVLYGQLEAANICAEARSNAYELYMELLRPLEARGDIQLPVIPAHCQSNHHIFYFLVSDIETRSSLINHLKRAGVSAAFHFVPLHSSPYGQQYYDQDRPMMNTDAAAACVVRLPLYVGLSEEDINRIVQLVYEFYGAKAI